MHNFFRKLSVVSLSLLSLLAANLLAFASDTTVPPVTLHNAEHVAAATRVAILSAARAGSRIVAVGDHGVILLSDDEGKSYRQARLVPTDLTLTATYFIDGNNGWAVGHGGVIVATIDGGENWHLQRTDLAVDQPLFSVFFSDSKNGWAVGLWSLALHTTDGGKSWSTTSMPAPPGSKNADKNFYSIFKGRDGALLITSEQGFVLRSPDAGTTWSYAQTGYNGSLWTGIELHDGTLLVGGLRGSLLSSVDNGVTWKLATSNLKSSITGFVQQSNGAVLAVGLDGTMLVSTDDGNSFVGSTRDDRAALTAVLDGKGATPVLFSDSGPLNGKSK